MSERLRQLQRQRALIVEHLAWLDTEIARELPAHPAAPELTAVTATPPLKTLPLVTPEPVPRTVAEGAAPAAILPAEMDTLMETYAASERQNPAAIRRGCLGLAIGLFMALVAGLVLVWILFYRESEPPPAGRAESVERVR